MFRASSAHLQEDTVVYMQHMAGKLSNNLVKQNEIYLLNCDSFFPHACAGLTMDTAC